MTDDEIVRRMVDELAHHGAFELGMNATGALQLAGLLQLVLRHPKLDANNRRTAIMVIEQIRAHFADAPFTLMVMQQGDDPRNDRPWGTP